jgi:cytochrome bd-type quinol oxidase subunit 1
VVVQYTIEKWKDNFLFAAITLGFALVIVLFYWLGVSRKAHRMTYSQNKSD